MSEMQNNANYIRDHLEDGTKAKEYQEFLIRHFSTLWD